MLAATTPRNHHWRSRSRSSSTSSSSSGKKKERRTNKRKKSRNRKGRDDESDDDMVSPAFKTIGAPHLHGIRHGLPKYQRLRILERINGEFSRVKTSMLPEQSVDMLVIICANVAPTVLLKHPKVRRKGQLRMMVRNESQRLLTAQPSRLQHLGWDFSNLEPIARQLGYQQQWGEAIHQMFFAPSSFERSRPAASSGQPGGPAASSGRLRPGQRNTMQEQHAQSALEGAHLHAGSAYGYGVSLCPTFAGFPQNPHAQRQMLGSQIGTAHVLAAHPELEGTHRGPAAAHPQAPPMPASMLQALAFRHMPWLVARLVASHQHKA